MIHVMTDLETLGTVPGCAILSIGAVVWCPDKGLGDEFYIVVNRQSCEDAFLAVDPKTVEWWTKQGEQARAVLAQAADKKQSVPLVDALKQFNNWMAKLGGPKSILMYGNGADFDNPILACAADAVKVKLGWASYNGRCYRQLKNMHELLGDGARAPKLDRSGTYHNALDDAKSQARHAIDIVRGLRKRMGSPLA